MYNMHQLFGAAFLH